MIIRREDKISSHILQETVRGIIVLIALHEMELGPHYVVDNLGFFIGGKNFLGVWNH